MIISIMLTCLGFLFAHRILRSSLQKIGFSNRTSLMFGVSAALMLLNFMLATNLPLVIWLFIGTILIFHWSLPTFFSNYLEFLIQKNKLRMLDHLVLGAHSGQSLRASLGMLSSQESSLLRIPWQNLFHAISFEGSAKSLKSAQLKGLFEDLVRIERSQSKCADQLRALRKQIKTLQDFRRKSGQVTMQIRMQAAISALLYAALLCFMISQFGFSENRTLILASGVLFSTGLVTVFVIGRRNQWTT